MSGIANQLFESKDIRFGPIDFEKDPEIESKWSHDSEYMRMFQVEAARPMSAAMVKKQYEKLEKQIGEDKNIFPFMIRSREDDRLIGKAAVQSVEWTNGNCLLHLGIGSPDDRRKGYGMQALGMLLRFAFTEINMFRVSARIPEYNVAAMKLFEKFGFTEEVRRRQALEREGRRWDLFVVGLLNDEWQSQAE